MKVTFNGSDEGTFYGVFDDAPSVGKVFPTTGVNELRKIKQPNNIEGVPYGTDEAGIRELLPATTKVLVSDGREFDADITWNTVTAADAGEYDAKVWTAKGVVNLPENVDNPENANYVDLNVKLTVSVDAAETALMPSMSLPDGVYLSDQWTTVTTNEEGGTTYFTTSQKGTGDLVIEDPTDPNAARAELTDDNNTFSISRLRALPTTVEGFDEDENLIEVPVKSVIVKAYTEAPGKRPSSVVAFEYQFRDVPVPEGQNSDYDGEEHVGVQASPYYTLSVGPDSNARVDEYGNVVATVPGTYTVTAKLALGNDYWEAEDQGPRSRADKTVEFTIAGTIPSDTSVHKFGIDASPTEGGTVAGAGTYVDGMHVSAKAWANEGYEFVNWTLVSDSPNLDLSSVFTMTKKFAGWTPKIAAVTGDAVYEATFTAKSKPSDPEEKSEPSDPGVSTVKMLRLYNHWSGEHFYTADEEEHANLVVLGWTDEGVGWMAPMTSDAPVYRLYNSYAGEHHYTLDESEKDALVALGWTDEGIAWYSDDAKTVPLYREYNPNEFANNHNYTADKVEHDGLVSIGWIDEGIAWYGASSSQEE